MTKVSGSYESVVRGVSEQNAQSRRSGQHEAQVNMISDPVRGLARRHGSIMQDELQVYVGSPNDFLAQTEKSRVIPFFVADTEYDAIVRTSSASGSAAKSTLIQCFNKASRQFIPVSITAGALTGQLISGGVSASANVGRFLYIAGNSIVPAMTETPKWADAANKSKLAGWVRSGAYARIFEVTLVRANGTRVTGSYTTKSSSYPELLDTSGISIGSGDPAAMNAYQKAINDATNDYNSRATAWIGEAAQDITPANIAQKLVDSLIANGATPLEVRREDSYVVATSGYVEIEMTDNGDDSLVRSVGNVISNLDLVSSRHFVGKVLKVEPEKNAGDPVYLEAFAKDENSTGWAEVVWREAAGYQMAPTAVFAFATVHNGTLHITNSAAELAGIIGSDVPSFEPNKVGDGGSAPKPEFFGKRIDYMGVFQDRLIIGSGSTLMLSRSGDYLNWFRKSVLTINDDDPWEGYALGAEDDTIKHSALYDRSLLLYGERFQYIINGRQTLTPTSANIAIASSYSDAIDAAPKPAGNFVFYAKYSGRPGKEVSSLHQVQPGVVADVSDSYPASQALDTYLQGIPVEILTMQAPNMVLLRTSKDRLKVFTYSYIDNPNTSERLFDSWSHWQWDEGVGALCGLGKHKSNMLLYMIRWGAGEDGLPTVWYAAEQFVRETDLSDYPYLDSLRPVGSAIPEDRVASASVAVERGPVQQYLGLELAKLDEFVGYYPDLTSSLWVGYNYPAYVTPTNPFMRDRNNQAILGGRLTLGKVKVAVTDTGGMICDVVARNLSRNTLTFTGKVLGALSTQVGVQPIVTSDVSAIVGGEVRECKYTLSAHKWLPLTINAIEWQGQWFFNTRRA